MNNLEIMYFFWIEENKLKKINRRRKTKNQKENSKINSKYS